MKLQVSRKMKSISVSSMEICALSQAMINVISVSHGVMQGNVIYEEPAICLISIRMMFIYTAR